MKRTALILGALGFVVAIGVIWCLARYPAEPTVDGVNICDLCIQAESTDPELRAAAEQKLRQIGYPAVEAVLASLKDHNPHDTLPAKLGAVVSGLLKLRRDEEYVGFMPRSDYRLAASLSVFSVITTNGQHSAEALDRLLQLKRWEDICGCWAGPLSYAFASIGEPGVPVLRKMLLRGGTSGWIATDAVKRLGPMALPLLPELENQLKACRDQFAAYDPAVALARMGLPGVKVLKDLLVAGNTRCKSAIAEALFRSNQASHAGEELLTVVQTSSAFENRYGHEWAAIALAISGHNRQLAAQLFAARLSTESEDDASYSLALRLLGDTGTRYLAAAMGNDNETVRMHAAYALSCEIRHTDSRPLLLYNGWGTTNDVFNYHLPPRPTEPHEAVAAFKLLLRDKDPEVRRFAMDASSKWMVNTGAVATALKPVILNQAQSDGEVDPVATY